LLIFCCEQHLEGPSLASVDGKHGPFPAGQSDLAVF
jgi:hypothetical protein